MTRGDFLLQALKSANEPLHISVDKSADSAEVKTSMSGTSVGLMVATASLIQRIADELSAGPEGVAALIIYRDIINQSFDRAMLDHTH